MCPNNFALSTAERCTSRSAVATHQRRHRGTQIIGTGLYHNLHPALFERGQMVEHSDEGRAVYNQDAAQANATRFTGDIPHGEERAAHRREICLAESHIDTVPLRRHHNGNPELQDLAAPATRPARCWSGLVGACEKTERHRQRSNCSLQTKRLSPSRMATPHGETSPPHLR